MSADPNNLFEVSGVVLANLDGGTTNVVHVGPSGKFTVSFTYSLAQCMCKACYDQLEVGLVPSPEMLGCAYSDQACPDPRHNVSYSQTFDAPPDAGPYDFRVQHAQDYGCGANWYPGAPGPGMTVGTVCVD